jgi:hypothetical protein
MISEIGFLGLEDLIEKRYLHTDTVIPRGKDKISDF